MMLADGYLNNYEINGDQLRYDTAIPNIGDGPLHLYGGAVYTDTGTQDVYQRVFKTDGTYSDSLVGAFVFHQGHGHIHFDGYSQANIRTVTPDGGVGYVVAQTDKLGFCFLDLQVFDPNHPNIPPAPVYNSCGQVQGVSPGYMDAYERSIEGQSINIANVPPGDYWLEVTADVDNKLLEHGDKTNNTGRVRITIPPPQSVKRSGVFAGELTRSDRFQLDTSPVLKNAISSDQAKFDRPDLPSHADVYIGKPQMKNTIMRHGYPHTKI